MSKTPYASLEGMSPTAIADELDRWSEEMLRSARVIDFENPHPDAKIQRCIDGNRTLAQLLSIASDTIRRLIP